MCKRQRGYNVILGPALHSSIAAARCDTLQPSQIGLTRDKEHTVLLCKKKGSHSYLRLPIQKQFSLHSCFYSKRLYTLNGLLCADVPLRNYSLSHLWRCQHNKLQRVPTASAFQNNMLTSSYMTYLFPRCSCFTMRRIVVMSAGEILNIRHVLWLQATRTSSNESVDVAFRCWDWWR